MSNQQHGQDQPKATINKPAQTGSSTWQNQGDTTQGAGVLNPEKRREVASDSNAHQNPEKQTPPHPNDEKFPQQDQPGVGEEVPDIKSQKGAFDRKDTKSNPSSNQRSLHFTIEERF